MSALIEPYQNKQGDTQLPLPMPHGTSFAVWRVCERCGESRGVCNVLGQLWCIACASDPTVSHCD